MRTLCPVCNGRGTINDPIPCGPMSYSGPNGESWPQIVCQNCDGSGWVGTPDSGKTKEEPHEIEEEDEE